MTARIDHLVVAARTLDEGVMWAQNALGATPGPGGAHALFGTHNRLLRLDGDLPAYLEIIAIDPSALPTRAAPLKRWFDLDDPALQARLTTRGPQLVHWVARVDDIDAARHAWSRQGIDRGPALEATRPTPGGLLRWQITVRDDGARLFDGALPTLIQWGDTHPTDAMPGSGLSLHSLALAHPDAPALRAALDGIGLGAVPVGAAGPALRAVLTTPHGPVHLNAT